MQFDTNRSDDEELVDDPFARYAAAKSAVAEAERNLAEAKEELIEHMAKNKQKTAVVLLPGARRTYTVARQRRVKVDEGGLLSALGAREFNKYAPRKFNKALLEEAMEVGKIEPKVVAPFITVEEGDPYITFTEKESLDEF